MILTPPKTPDNFIYEFSQVVVREMYHFGLQDLYRHNLQRYQLPRNLTMMTVVDDLQFCFSLMTSLSAAAAVLL